MLGDLETPVLARVERLGLFVPRMVPPTFCTPKWWPEPCNCGRNTSSDGILNSSFEVARSVWPELTIPMKVRRYPYLTKLESTLRNFRPRNARVAGHKSILMECLGVFMSRTPVFLPHVARVKPFGMHSSDKAASIIRAKPLLGKSPAITWTESRSAKAKS